MRRACSLSFSAMRLGITPLHATGSVSPCKQGSTTDRQASGGDGNAKSISRENENSILQGFQQQTAKWPVQPVEVAAEYLRGHSKKLTVADFGCGDAQLAAMASQKVHSMDLVSSAPGVIACNMAHTPLGEAAGWASIIEVLPAQ